MKKNWSKPKLVILVKGNPDEVLENVCRHPNSLTPGPSNNYNRCNVWSNPEQTKCRGCSAQPTS